MKRGKKGLCTIFVTISYSLSALVSVTVMACPIPWVPAAMAACAAITGFVGAQMGCPGIPQILKISRTRRR